MQIHLKGLKKEEYKALMSIGMWVLNGMGEPMCFEDFEDWDALRDMTMEMARRIPELREQNNFTLRADAAMALWMRVDVTCLPPFEAAVMISVHGELDRQWHERLSMLKGNMSPAWQMLEGGEI